LKLYGTVHMHTTTRKSREISRRRYTGVIKI
jgi:hypothetical protein